MADEIVSYLVMESSGAYLDLTAGLGGHLLAISKRLNNDAKLFGVDRDDEALSEAKEKLKDVEQTVQLWHGSYRETEKFREYFKREKFDGILLDLGLSSLQIDDSSRGFSFSQDSPLDMRFDRSASAETAQDIINNYDEKELAKIFFDYGEEKQARKIAFMIVKERQNEMIKKSNQLRDIVRKCVHPKFLNKSLARVFQSLRIVVNKELEALESLLEELPDLLVPGGRVAVLSYHSLEDRLVKHSFIYETKDCVCPKEFLQCVCDKEARLKIITRKALLPSAEEQELNRRSRSAKLRVAERI